MKPLTVTEKSHLLLDSEIFHELSAEESMEFANEISEQRVQAGETLFQRGDIGEHVYVVIAGRFRICLDEASESQSQIEDIRRGEVIGEFALLTGDRRAATVRAVRDSSVLVIPKSSFEQVVQKCPRLMLAIGRLEIERLHRAQHTKQSAHTLSEAITLVPAGSSLDIGNFAARLAESLSQFGTVLHVKSADDIADETTARNEEGHRFVIYEADSTSSSWTSRCIRQADRVILVANANSDPRLNTIETEFNTVRGTYAWPHRDLVIVHTRNGHTSASPWLASRSVEMHHHVKDDNPGDYARVARFIAGKATGLVLSGGGARAFAHIGVIQALAEAGISIDVVGGTSMGALIAAMVALDIPPEQMAEFSKYIFIKRGIWDFTFPFVSLVAAKRITTSLQALFSDVAIEDLPRNYFCVTTNLSKADVCVHQRGSLLKWVKASVSIPGIAPPVVSEGDLLYDGGVLNNLPVDVIKRFGTACTIAVNVGSLFDAKLLNVQPESCSPWKILLNKINPFSRNIPFPNIFHILYRASMLNSLRLTAVAAQTNVSLVIDPQVSQFGLFEWKAIDEIIEAGLLRARDQLAHW